jgi:hypothetical protein
MIIVVAAIAAILTVPLSGVSLAPLSRVTFRGSGLVWLAIGAQIVITAAPLFPNWLGRPLHLTSFVLAAVFIWLNRRLPGVLFVAVGAGMNLAAIAANGGVMPASAAAWRSAGLPTTANGFDNSHVIAHARLPWLGDAFAIPRGWPFANVFSVGDVVVVFACGYFAHAWCRRFRPSAASGTPASLSTVTS